MGRSSGFTLIELLVVIAIIGLLASVVLASLNTARDKGAAASIKANINNARVQAELYYDNNTNSYAGVCGAGTAQTGPGIQNMINAADSANGGVGTAACHSSAGAWAAEARLLPETPTLYYCVDSTGVGDEFTCSKNTATACNLGCRAP